MKKQMRLSLLEEETRTTGGSVTQKNDSFRDKIYRARVADNKTQALNTGTKLSEPKLIIDPRDGNLKLTNNPILLMHDMIKRNFDGSLQFVNELGKGLSTPMNYCDEYIWIEKENGEIKGI